MSATLHITAKLKPGTVSGMRVSGTVVAVNAAGISFPQYVQPVPTLTARSAVVAWTMAADTFSATGTTDREAGLTVFTAGSAIINARLSASANVGLADGIYMIDSLLEITSNHALSPISAGGLVVLKSTTSYAGRFAEIAGANNVQFNRIVFDGQYASRIANEGNDSVSILYVFGGSSMQITSCTFRNAPSYAFWAYNQANTTIDGNTFTECYQPIRMDLNGLSAGSITNNVMTNTSAYPSLQHIDVFGNGVGLKIVGNTFTGIGAKSASSHGFEGTWGNSIYVTYVTNVSISGNTVNSPYWSSLVLGAGAVNCTVANNTFDDGEYTTASAAIWVEQPSADVVTIRDNILHGMVTVGDTGGDHITIANNQIDSRSYGINLNSECRNSVISGNTITNRLSKGVTDAWGIYLWEKNSNSVSVQVTNNVFIDWGRAVWCNNGGGVGTIYGIDVTGSTFTNCSSTAVCPVAITIDPSCSGIGQI